jgi:hypothetical protein
MFRANADTISTGAALPANLTLPGGAGCSASAPYTPPTLPGQTVLTVGAGEEYQTIAQAVAASASGDLILVQPGTYTNDFADIGDQITIAGAGGMVNMVATEDLPNEKGFFIVDNSVQIDNFNFQGAQISDADGGNGAGIRYQGGAMVLHNDAFVGNQDGILAAAVDNLPVNTVSIQGCTFDDNGDSTGAYAGYTHNCYISTGITSLIATGNIFEEANIGHELKSRAVTNVITGNIFYDGPTGTASYDIDLPNGGADTVSGNIIEKGPDAQNTSMIHFGGEGIPYAGSTLTVTGNHFINDMGAGVIGVLNQTMTQVSMTGNEFDNFEQSQLASGEYTESGNTDEQGRAIAPSSSSNFAPGTNLDDFSHDSNAHSIVLTTSTGVLGGGGKLTVVADAGHVTVVGGSGGLTYHEAANVGGSEIITAAGATDSISLSGQDEVDSAGTDTIIGGTGNLSIEVDGHAHITSGSGSNDYNVIGQTSIVGAGGSDTVQLNSASSSAVISGAETYLQVTVNGGRASYSITEGGAAEQATITGGASETRIYGGTENVTTSGAGAGSSIVFGAGTATLFSMGADTVHAGGGTDTVIVSASSQIFGGSGTLSVYGRSDGGMASVYGAHGSIFIGGDTGDITYFGGGAANTVNATLSNITLQGGAGLMHVTGGSRQSIQGGAGGLVLTTTGGADVITTAAGAHDTVSFAGACSLVSNGTDVIAAGSGNSVITANGAATITGSTGSAFYTLNGADSLNGYGYTRATVGAGAHDTVANDAGVSNIVLSSGGSVAFSQLGNADHETATVSGAGASLWSDAGSVSTTINLAGTGDAATLGGGTMEVGLEAQGTQLATGAATATVNVVQGGSVVEGGSGALTIGLWDWADQAVTSVLGGSGTVTIRNGSGNLVFMGGSGSANLAGTQGMETVTAGSGNLTLQGGSAGTVFTAGSGTAMVVLSPGGGSVNFGSGATTVAQASYGAADLYTFTAGQGGGTDIITGFRPGTDQLVFNGVSVTNDVAVGGSTQLTLSDGTHVTLSGVAAFAVLPPHH